MPHLAFVALLVSLCSVLATRPYPCRDVSSPTPCRFTVNANEARHPHKHPKKGVAITKSGSISMALEGERENTEHENRQLARRHR